MTSLFIISVHVKASTDYILQFHGQKNVVLYYDQKVQLLKAILKNKIPAIQGPIVLQVKAFVQQYTNRMLDKKRTVTL
jgi:hypothetical protein